MPIQGNGMQSRPGQSSPNPNFDTANPPRSGRGQHEAKSGDPIDAAVSKTLGKLDTGLAEVAANPGPDPAALKAEVETEPKLKPDDAKAVAAALTSPGGLEQPRSNGEVIKGGSEVVLDPDLPRDELERRLLALRDPPPPVVYVPSPPTARMVANTEAEMAAGRRRNAHFEEMERNRPKPEPDPRDGTSIEVRRDGQYVHEKGNNNARAV